MHTHDAARTWQHWPILFWTAGVGALCSLLAALIQEVAFFMVLLNLSPYGLVMACAVMAERRWACGPRGLLLGLPILLGIPFQLHWAFAAAAGKWTTLGSLWITASQWIALAAWWPLVLALFLVRDRLALGSGMTADRRSQRMS